MNMRGKWAEVDSSCLKINVTSCQQKNKYRRAFSPMNEIKGGYKGFYCFENYWQSGKIYKDIDRLKCLEWWQKQTKGKRRYPNSKNKKVLHAQWSHIEQPLDYISSRKKVYIPEYYNLIKNKETLKELIKIVNSGKNIAIFDIDGPRLDDNSVTSLLVTLELLKNKVKDTRNPFGHGYIVAGILAGYPPEIYL